ncbi:hypothetical protein Ctob_000642 [Chrysochromulina tobinii]|uniref:Uncharacterized protein n=1 Tax=Chrysochromulina tobinii TaxID=1460289 RepID=A0A0M0J870_9EUKA|nr:hypothetical protein Ctob_000642 [Chrysochromulina tobinii]|eukprot:KOO22796.1 hypothetical protein Ctob_000642 [Chrysochromulina sp. CCMP291]
MDAIGVEEKLDDEVEVASSRSPVAAGVDSPPETPPAGKTISVQQCLYRQFARAWVPPLCTFLITLSLRLLFILTTDPGDRIVASFPGSQVAIRCDANGRYLEVSPDGWVFASAFTHNRLSARFDVEPVSPELLRSLVHTREFRERAGNVGVRHWDMRPRQQRDAWDGYEGAPAWGGYEASAADASQGDVDRHEPLQAEEEEQLRQRLERSAAQGEQGWVLLRSPYAGGYVEVISRGEEDEYVVRVAADGKLSYRSLFVLEPEAVWSYAVGGALNWRHPDASDPKQHVRAHGNSKPYGPLRSSVPTARLLVFRPPPVVDVLSALACPTAVPPFEWALLLDAARAGVCSSASLGTLRTAASALEQLEAILGAAFSVELGDLATSYRTILLDETWLETLDLQLRRCSVEGRPLDDPTIPFSRVDAAAGELLHVPLRTDAVFVLCDFEGDDGFSSTGPNERREGAETSADEGVDELAPFWEEAYSSQLSVLLLMLDATSRAHLHRMVPQSLALLRALASSGAATLYEFPFYSIVGFNSVPNMVPMLTGVDAEAIINLPPVGSYASHLYDEYEDEDEDEYGALRAEDDPSFTMDVPT